jgi:hypothetical protein
VSPTLLLTELVVASPRCSVGGGKRLIAGADQPIKEKASSGEGCLNASQPASGCVAITCQETYAVFAKNSTLNERRVASVAWHGRRVIFMQRFGGSAAGSQALLLGEAERTIWSSQAELKTRLLRGESRMVWMGEEGCDASPAWIGNSGVKWGRAAGLIR